MPKMEYTAQVLRGWPGEGGLERLETVKVGSTLINGDVVLKQADGSVDKVSTTSSGAVGLVIRGNGDSGSVVTSGKAVVLWSGYIVQVSNYNQTSLPAAWAPGVAVTGGGTAATGKFNTTTATDSSVIGYCLAVTAVSTTDTANVVIYVK